VVYNEEVKLSTTSERGRKKSMVKTRGKRAGNGNGEFQEIHDMTPHNLGVQKVENPS
jgi:hypothetical protein